MFMLSLGLKRWGGRDATGMPTTPNQRSAPESRSTPSITRCSLHCQCNFLCGLHQYCGRFLSPPNNVCFQDSTGSNVERLNEHSLEDYLGRQRATTIYIVGGWVCHSFNKQDLSPVVAHLSRYLTKHEQFTPSRRQAMPSYDLGFKDTTTPFRATDHKLWHYYPAFFPHDK